MTKPGMIRAWMVVWVTSLFFFYEFGLNNIFNALEPYISSEYSLGATATGLISSLYFYANIAALVPAGMLLDRFSPKKLILMATWVCIISLSVIAFSHSLIWMILARFAMGLGGGFCFIGCMRIAVNWIPESHMATASGLIVTMGMLGGFMVQMPMTVLINQVGWHHAVFGVAIVGLLVFFCILLFVKDHAPWVTHEYAAGKQDLSALGLSKSFKLVFKNPQNWLAGLYTSLVNLPIFILGALWGIPYLMQVHHFNNTTAASIAGMLFIGTMLGSSLVGMLSDRLGSRRGLMFVGALAAFVLMLIIIKLNLESGVLLSILFFLLGLITSTQVLSYPLVAAHNPRMVASTAISVISMMCLLGGALSQPIFGKILALHAEPVMIHGAPVYGAVAYQSAIQLLPLAFLIAFFLVFWIREPHHHEVILKG